MKEKKEKKKHFWSLRFRLLVAMLGVAITSIVILSGLSHMLFQNSLVEKRKEKISHQLTVLGNQITAGGAMYLSISDNVLQDLQLFSDDYDGRCMVINTMSKVLYDTAEIDVGRYLLDPRVLQALGGKNLTEWDAENKNVVSVVPISMASSETVLGVLVFTGSCMDLMNQMSRLDRLVFAADLTGLLVLFFLILAIIHFALAPYKTMRDGIQKVAEGEEKHLADLKYRETEEIVETFNLLMDRLHIQDQSRQEFVSNVSHELKTPITSMRVLADSLLTMPDAPKELYQEFMQDISKEIDREAKIISDLLELVRMDNATVQMSVSMVNINEWLQDIMKRLLPIANQRKIELVMESFRDVVAEIDETKLSLAISNLIENAIKYNRDKGFVHVSLNADHKFFYIKVEDNGVGIPEDAQDKIFDRFYRVDKARSRDAGGTGLGLSITKGIIQMHRGAIKVYSKVGDGTTFSVRLPLNYKEPR